MPTPFADLTLGTVADDATGESLRSGGTKINANFQIIEDVLSIDDVNDRIGINRTTPDHMVHVIHGISKSTTEQSIQIENSKSTRVGGPARAINIIGNYTGIETSGDFPMEGIRSLVNYGGTGGVAANGNIHAGALICKVTGNDDVLNEHAALYGELQYQAGVTGRGWLTDLKVFGSTVQQSLLSGVTLILNNQFDGVPIAADSYAFGATTRPGVAPSDTTYPVDIGFLVVGRSGPVASPTSVGFKTGFKAGGAGSGWGLTASILERAFWGRDVTIEGLRLDNPGAGSPKGIVMSGATWGTLIDMSGVTSPPAVGILMPDSGLQWATDGGGEIGSSASGRPLNVFAKTSLVAAGGWAILSGTLSGGHLIVVKKTAAIANQTTDKLAIYARDGTNVNTLKLVVKAGAGAEQTILDNVPTA